MHRGFSVRAPVPGLRVAGAGSPQSVTRLSVGVPLRRTWGTKWEMRRPVRALPSSGTCPLFVHRSLLQHRCIHASREDGRPSSPRLLVAIHHAEMQSKKELKSDVLPRNTTRAPHGPSADGHGTSHGEPHPLFHMDCPPCSGPILPNVDMSTHREWKSIKVNRPRAASRSR